jgi:hypothetical protein
MDYVQIILQGFILLASSIRYCGVLYQPSHKRVIKIYGYVLVLSHYMFRS